MPNKTHYLVALILLLLFISCEKETTYIFGERQYYTDNYCKITIDGVIDSVSVNESFKFTVSENNLGSYQSTYYIDSAYITDTMKWLDACLYSIEDYKNRIDFQFYGINSDSVYFCYNMDLFMGNKFANTGLGETDPAFHNMFFLKRISEIDDGYSYSYDEGDGELKMTLNGATYFNYYNNYKISLVMNLKLFDYESYWQ